MRWKSRFVAFIICFAIGLVAAVIVAAMLGRFGRKQNERSTDSACAAADYFNSPEEVLAALRSPEVNVRRTMLSQLLLRPDIGTVYYDYERDLNYPERADRARLQYVQLDHSSQTEALLTFVRLDNPLALVFKKKDCGWKLVAALSSWLRFEDYPYENWLSLPEAIEPGIHQLLIRDSDGDATSYVRKARLLKLDGDVLTQVAEIEEEAFIRPGLYDESDWRDVKLHRINKFTFINNQAGQVPTITNEVTEEMVRLTGTAPHYSYWLETDGTWHARESNWSRRPAKRVNVLNVSRKDLVWNPQEGRFVATDNTD
jgi:hypothetical protein